MPPPGDTLAVDCTALIPREVSGKDPWSWADHILLGHTRNLEHRHLDWGQELPNDFISRSSWSHTRQPLPSCGLQFPPLPPWTSPVTLIPFSFLKQLVFKKPLFIYKVIPGTAYSKVLVCLFASPRLGQGVFLSLGKWPTGTSPGYKYRSATWEPFFLGLWFCISTFCHRNRAVECLLIKNRIQGKSCLCS